MALWAKIQSLNTDCQRQILSLYSEEHQKYKFPIEVRNLFAEVIENAVCGGSITSLDAGLDPYNTDHRDLIINFFTTLIGQLEERLGNTQSGDQFFTRHKLSEALTNLTDNKQTDPLGMYDLIRNRLKTEVSLVLQQEAAASNNMPHERDAILDNIQEIKTQISDGTNILKEIRSNEAHFALHCNKKQDLEAILGNTDQVRIYNQQSPDYESRVRASLATLEGLLQQNICTFQALMQRFEQVTTHNLNNIAILQGQIISEKLTVWKHEQQQMANGIPKTHLVGLERLQLWCEELCSLIWKTYEQLKEAEDLLQNGIMQTGNAADLTFVQSRTEDVLRLLQELLNQSLIVEDQPPQIIKMKTKFPKPVNVSMLVGKRLNLHMNRPELTARLISEEQARALPVTDKLETIGEITNGKVQMDNSKDDFKRLTFPFRTLQLKSIKRTDRRGSNSNERVMEEKSCLYFECMVTVGPVKFKVSTISLPVVVISHGSQEALAVASISWDNAFGEPGRVPFRVPTTAPWEDVSQILSAKFKEVTGRGLTPDNLTCLAKKVFGNRNPWPETITWSELCKENMRGRNFTFWAWFHAALKLIEKKETHLKELWKEGLINGFIERETAEALISRCNIGTFLMRFSDSICGSITIVLLNKGSVVSLNPFQMLDLQSKKLSMSIRDIEKLKYLYQPNHSIPKDEVFGKFYDRENSQAHTTTNGYVDIVPTIPDGENSGGCATPVPFYDGRYSHGSLPGLSPISIDQSHSPFFVHPPSPQSSVSTYLAHSPASNIGNGMDYYDSESSQSTSHNGLLFPASVPTGPISPSSNQGDLVTPLPVSVTNGSMFEFTSETEFADLITVIREDIQMDEQV